MQKITDNMDKYLNYQEQMTKLNKAMKAEYHLEAIFIEYAVLEDRLESLLRHAGYKAPRNINAKLDKVKEIGYPIAKYVSAELVEQIRAWKNRRNPLIHALMVHNVPCDELLEIAVEGQMLAKAMCSKSTSFRRFMEKEALKQQEQQAKEKQEKKDKKKKKKK